VPFDFETTPITQDLTMYAHFEPLVLFHTVLFMDGEEQIGEAVVLDGETVSEVPDAPVHPGQEFAGWCTADGDLFDFRTPITQDLTLYASYTKLTYTVTFLWYNGEAVIPCEYGYVLKDDEIPEVPADEGEYGIYTFACWSPEVVRTVTEDATYEAVYDYTPYSEVVTVSLDQVGTVIYISVVAEDEGSVIKSGTMELQYTYLVKKTSYGKERYVVMTSSVIEIPLAGGAEFASAEYDLGSEEHLSTISTVWATYTADGIDSEKSVPIIFEPVDLAALAAGKE
jgi:hypothetical protein